MNQLNNPYINGQLLLKGKGGDKIAAWVFIPKIDLLLMHAQSTAPIQQRLLLLRLTTTLLLCLTIGLLYVVIKYTTKKLMSRIYSVIIGMKQVNQGNLNIKIKIDGTDEISETQKTFNSMTEQLREQIDLIKKEQALVTETEIKAMQNQINAHFLYNVLETIKMQAVLADEDDIAESITVLGKMMRYCLRWRQHRVTLQQEIEYACSYIYILNIRNDYVISLETEIPSEFSNIEIPKMILPQIARAHV